ncbi:MAG: hypothetical protein H7A41_05360 [Chlamydiales bacterium]|nr:hypothetical protein [Chlamydiales bacterium]
MAISITKIPFFQPMDRDRDYPSALNKVLWALYDVGIDGVLSSPFATKCYHVHENGLNQAGKKKFDILNPSGASSSFNFRTKTLF